MELYLLALAGAVLHVLFKYKTVIEKVGYKSAAKDFDWVRQGITSAIGLFSVFILVYLKDSLAGLIEITELTAVVIGYLGDSVFKNIILKEQKKLNEPG